MEVNLVNLLQSILRELDQYLVIYTFLAFQ
jgi:hypothetical protein